jgi:hypothetical protein
MSVLVGESPQGGYVLTDLGETMADLRLSGVNLHTAKRIETLDRFVSGYGVRRSQDGELYVRCSRSDMAGKMNMLIQAMASVDDMFMVSQDSVRELFALDVGEWMLENDIRALEGPSFPGRSGLMYKFDYAIARTKARPERLIKTVNRPNESSVRNALFGWQDVEASRRGAIGYVFLNAANGKDGIVPPSAIAACEAYGIVPIQWGVDHMNFVDELAA